MSNTRSNAHNLPNLPETNTPKFEPANSLALISMPWSIFNRPSIQLACLKSYLDKHLNESGSERLRIDNVHPYLRFAKLIGTELYHHIALSGWGGEALFSPLLFPEKKSDARTLFHETVSSGKSGKASFDKLIDKTEIWSNQFLSETNWGSYDLIGFSVCFSQLLPSLYLSRLIKTKYPETVIAFGGSSCSGQIGQSLLEEFREVDYVIDGEGEYSLLNLVNYLFCDEDTKPLSARIHKRKAGKSSSGSARHCVKDNPVDINELPVPDFTAYFKEMAEQFGRQPFIPVLPIEFSRGCWWDKCTFCNLNVQWANYRYKDAEVMFTQTLELVKKHESLHFTFTDNALPPQAADLFFKEISALGADFDFFAEIRASTSSDRLQLYRRSGLKTVQVGVEALSTSLLNKMTKGTSTIDNIAIMKFCSRHSIKMEGNLIVEFPGSSDKEVSETLENLDYVLPFAPLNPASFFLGYGSPIHSNPEEFSLQAIVNHPRNKKIFPKKILQSLTSLIYSYRGDRQKQTKLWKPVREKIEIWQQFHQNRNTGAVLKQQPLQYSDGLGFLIIRQERLDGLPLIHRLRGLSRKIYLFCDTSATFEDILSEFPKLSEQALSKFVSEMCEKRLMYTENNKVISLSVPQYG